MVDGLNLDPLEVARFEAHAEDWWDPKGPFRPLHQLNPIRLGYVADRAQLAGRHVLDVGCGGGLLAEEMAARGAHVTGIDMSAGAIATARLHAAQHGLAIDYRATTAETLAVAEPNGFDVVTCMELIEHVPDPSGLVAACFALARPGGDVFFSTINRTPRAYALAVIAAEYVLRLLPRGTHDYARFVRPADLARWVRRADGTVADVTGIAYNPVFGRASLTRSTEVNYLLHAHRAPAAAHGS